IAYAPRTTAARPPAAGPVTRAADAAPMVGLCPRCAYRGEGVGYFTRGRHVAGLVVATMFTSWAMGAGGLVYFLLRREHRVCPRCGEGWGRRNSYPLVPASAYDAVPAPLPA